MICAIEGEIIAKEPSFCDIMTAAGVAYRLHISLATYANLAGKRARLLTSHVVREDAQLLFGFSDDAERTLFEMLIKISGVGPKSAIAILSTFTPAQFAEAIANGDEKQLIRVPGIGKKSAGLIIVQLGGSVDRIGGFAPIEGSPQKEASLALESLGFKPPEISKALAKCAATETVGLIKEALKILRR